MASNKDIKYLKGIISFPQTADYTNTIVYKNNDGNKLNYIIPDVKEWNKLDSGHVIIECNNGQVYDFEDTYLRDKNQYNDLYKTHSDMYLALASVGINYGKDIQFIDDYIFVEADKKDGKEQQIAMHQFDICNKNHWLVCRTNGETKDIRINARDIERMVGERNNFVLKVGDSVIASRGLEAEIKLLQQRAIDRETMSPEAQFLLNIGAEVGKPIMILTSEAVICDSKTKEEIDISSVKSYDIVGKMINIDGLRLNLNTGDLIEVPEQTPIIDMERCEIGDYTITIIEGTDSMYVRFDWERELILEKTRGVLDSGAGAPDKEQEAQLYYCLYEEVNGITNNSGKKVEKEIDKTDVLSPDIQGPTEPDVIWPDNQEIEELER